MAALACAIEGCTDNKNRSRTPSPGVSGPPASSGGPPASLNPSAVKDLDALARSLGDRLIRPSDPRYRSAAQLYSIRFDDVRPAAIARCASIDDVQRCLDFIRATGLPVAARSGGHSYAGYSTTSGLVIDVAPMRQVGPGASPNTARIGAGATLVDVYAGLAAKGQGIPVGSCPTVGITGSSLGGGIGVLGRKHGLSCDALTAVELVTPDGNFLRCSENNEPELFWAHRGGGGGNFGIVTALEFRTHTTRSLTRFLLRWDWARAHDVVSAWQQWMPSTPNELWSNLHIDAPQTASDQSRVYVSGVYIGSPDDLRPLLDSLRAAAGPTATGSSVKEDGYLQTMLVEAGCANLTIDACHRSDTDPRGKLGRDASAARSDFIDKPLGSAAIDVVLAAIDNRHRLGLLKGSVLFDAYGGAINAVPAGDTAFVHRATLACLQYVAPWPIGAPKTTVEANQRWLDDLYTAMRPYVSGYAYLNYIDAELIGWQRAYYGDNLDRLVKVKAAVDPTDLLRFGQGLPTRLPSA